jgi:hypothetical protein
MASNGGATNVISTCVVSGGKVTLTWGAAASSVNFVVSVLNAGPWTATAAN